MKEKSWICTIITQLSLCTVGYIAINIGQPQKLTHGNISSEGRPNDMYFISVAGGFRSLEEQTLLLQQFFVFLLGGEGEEQGFLVVDVGLTADKMVKVEKTYKARFVVEFSELGESDPLLQNATMFPELQNMPWYPSGALEGQGETYFLKKIEIPYGQTLDIIALDTAVLLQDQSSARGNDQILWLTRTLNESNSDWKIVVGFHQLISCDYNISRTKETTFEPLHNILLQYGVDAYMSMKTCAGNIQGGTMRLSDTGPMDKGPYLTSMNQNFVSKEETVDGFLLHQVSSLEMVTFVVKLTGEIEHRLSFQQKGRAAM